MQEGLPSIPASPDFLLFCSQTLLLSHASLASWQQAPIGGQDSNIFIPLGIVISPGRGLIYSRSEPKLW